jgi:hypothetical protein
MLLTLTRDVFTDTATLGTLTVTYDLEGTPRAFGFTCEDVDRDLHQTDPLPEIEARKVKGKTAIPAGRYRVQWTWSPKYRRYMPILVDVPGYQGIRIHSGNTAEDTEGCILPGLTRDVTAMSVGKSRDAARWLDGQIEAHARAGEAIWIEIVRARVVAP